MTSNPNTFSGPDLHEDGPTPQTPAREEAVAGKEQVSIAFLVVKRLNGEWQALPEYDTPVDPITKAGVLDMKTGCAEVVSDIDASKIAAMTAHQMMQMTMQMQQQAASQQLVSQLKL